MKFLVWIVLFAYMVAGCSAGSAEQEAIPETQTQNSAVTASPTENTAPEWSVPTENDEIPFHVIDSEDKPWEGDYEIDIPRVPNKETALAFAEAVLVAYEYHFYAKPKHLIGVFYYEKYDVWNVSYAWEPKYPGATIDIAIKGSTGEILSIWPGE